MAEVELSPWSHKRDYLFKFIPPLTRSQLMLDEEAAYSVTDQYTADKMTRDIVRYSGGGGVICDATACVGGNASSFSRAFKHVVAIERNQTRYDYLVHNMNVLKAHNVKCILGDALEELTWGCTRVHMGNGGVNYDVIFIDPPWGGPDYKSQEFLSLELSDMPLEAVCRNWSKLTHYFALKTPKNFDEARFQAATGDFLKLVHKNSQLRKVTFYIFACK